MRALHARHRAFVRSYTGLSGPDIAWNATACAKAAGYPNSSAYTRGYELLNRPDVSAAIAEVVEELKKRHEALARKSIHELSSVAFVSITDVVNIEGGDVSIRDDMSPAAKAAIQEIQVDEKGRVKVRLHPKIQALQTLLKLTGHLQDRQVQVSAVMESKTEVKPAPGRGASLDQRSQIRIMMGLPPEIGGDSAA